MHPYTASYLACAPFSAHARGTRPCLENTSWRVQQPLKKSFAKLGILETLANSLAKGCRVDEHDLTGGSMDALDINIVK